MSWWITIRQICILIKILVYFCSIIRHYGILLFCSCLISVIFYWCLWHRGIQNKVCSSETMNMTFQFDKLLCGRVAYLQSRLLQPLGCSSLKESWHRILESTAFFLVRKNTKLVFATWKKGIYLFNKKMWLIFFVVFVLVWFDSSLFLVLFCFFTVLYRCNMLISD